MKTTWAAAILGLLGTVAPIGAHHSFMAEYDQKTSVTVTGVVTKVDWMNPHTYFYVEATDKDGKVVSWTFETGTPSQLTLRGWTQETLKAGDRITVIGYRARNGSHRAATRVVKMADGRKFLTGRTDGMDYDD